LDWCVCGPYGIECRQGVSAIDLEPRVLVEKFWNLKDCGAVKSKEKKTVLGRRKNSREDK